jgi:YtkA-like
MRTALLGAVVVAALTVAGAASAGCWATVGLSPPPEGTAAGEVWTAQLTVLQHGQNPLPDAADAAPTVTIVNQATGERRKFTAKPSDPGAGRYEARVVFPSAGAWSFRVFDGFTRWNGEPAPCAQTHTFAAAQIGGPGTGSGRAAPEAARPDESAFPLWPLVGGLGGLLVAALVCVYVLRRHGSRAPAAA